MGRYSCSWRGYLMWKESRRSTLSFSLPIATQSPNGASLWLNQPEVSKYGGLGDTACRDQTGQCKGTAVRGCRAVKHRTSLRETFFFFICLHQVLAAACGIFHCCMRDLALRPGIEPRPLCWKLRILAPGPPGKSLETWQNLSLKSSAQSATPGHGRRSRVLLLLILLCLSRVALHQAHQPCPTLTLKSGLPAVYSRPLHVPLTPLSLYTCSSLEWDPTPSSPCQAHLLLQHQSIPLTPSLSGWVPFLCFHAILCSARIVLGRSKSSFRFFCNMEKLEQTFDGPNIILWLRKVSAFWSSSLEYKLLKSRDDTLVSSSFSMQRTLLFNH